MEDKRRIYAPLGRKEFAQILRCNLHVIVRGHFDVKHVTQEFCGERRSATQEIDEDFVQERGHERSRAQRGPTDSIRPSPGFVALQPFVVLEVLAGDGGAPQFPIARTVEQVAFSYQAAEFR